MKTSSSEGTIALQFETGADAASASDRGYLLIQEQVQIARPMGSTASTPGSLVQHLPQLRGLSLDRDIVAGLIQILASAPPEYRSGSFARDA